MVHPPHDDNTGGEIQHNSQAGIIAGMQTIAIGAAVLKDAWDNRIRPVQVKAKQPGAKADREKAQRMLREGKSHEEIASDLRQRPEYKKLQSKGGKGEEYIQGLVISASRKNITEEKGIAKKQSSQRQPRKSL
ncbi:MAG: hypothetical protein ACRCYP_03335 [Alphaproteobacteria bacterium]